MKNENVGGKEDGEFAALAGSAHSVSINFPNCKCGGGLDVVNRHAPPEMEAGLAALLESQAEIPGVKVRCDKCEEEWMGGGVEDVMRRISPEWGAELDKVKNRERLNAQNGRMSH